VRKGLGNYTSQKKTRSGGDVFGTNPVTALEGIAAHLLTELHLRKWLKTIPLRTLTVVFETPSSIPELAAFAPAPERQAQIDEALKIGRAKRLALERWAPRQKRLALEQRRFEEAQEAVIEDTITVEFDGFKGAETPGSQHDRDIQTRIGRVARAGAKWLRTGLLHHLRDYQVRNNRHVVARESRVLTV
jgi:hypothetical protein